VVAATNRDLETAMARLQFREDLTTASTWFELRIPPLGSVAKRSRAHEWFLDRFNLQYAGRSGSRP
jgi:transcriptional regulator with GAF, ATPase, and Fis domain